MTRAPREATVATPQPPDCTTSMTWPTVDGIVAGLLTVAMISAISQDNNQATADDPDGDAVASGFIIAGAAGVSALVGHSRVSKCRRATDTYMAQAFGQQQPQGYGYPQQGYGYQYPQQGYPATYPQQYPPPTGYQQPPPAGYQPPPTYPAQPAPISPRPTPVQPPVAKPPVAKPPIAKPPEPVLGTEGDVCTAQADCASGFTCTGNVCLKAK